MSMANEHDSLANVIDVGDDWLDFSFDFEEGSDGTTSTLTENTHASNEPDTTRRHDHSNNKEPPVASMSKSDDIVTTIMLTDGKASGTKALGRKQKKSSARKIITATPNMSRRAKYSVLVAFPAYDKCDSLLFFPSTVTRLTNSGDITGLVNLCRSRFHKDCVTSFRDIDFSFQDFMGFFEVVFALYPDAVECVHETKVVENTIIATTLAKYTDSDAIYKYVSKQMKGTKFEALVPAKRADYLRNASFADDTVKNAFVESDLPDAGVDFHVYSGMTMRITFDDVRRKITRYAFEMHVTSIKPVEPVANNT